MMKKFKDWLKLREEATTTAGIATVPMRLFTGLVSRTPQMLGGEFISSRKKRKRKRK